jgi:hypothetical protein
VRDRSSFLSRHSILPVCTFLLNRCNALSKFRQKLLKCILLTNEMRFNCKGALYSLIKSETARYEIASYPVIRVTRSAHVSNTHISLRPQLWALSQSNLKTATTSFVIFFRPLVCVRTKQNDSQSKGLVILHIWYIY